MSFSVEKRESTGLGRFLGGIMTVATKHRKKGSLGEANSFYYHSELKRWVERGKEDEILAAAAVPPPPTTNHGLGSVTAKRRPITQRYKLQDNLQVAPRESREAASGDPFLPPPLISDRGAFLPPPRQGHNGLAPSGPASASSDCSSASSSTVASTRSNSATSLCNGFCTAFQSDFSSSTGSYDGGSGRSSCEGSDKEAPLPLAAGWAPQPTNPAPLQSAWAEQPEWRPTETQPTCAGAATPSVSVLCTFDSTQIVTQIAAALDSCSAPSAAPPPLACDSPCSSSASAPSPDSPSTPNASGGVCSSGHVDGEYVHRADLAAAAAVMLLETVGEDAGAAAAAKSSTAVPVSVSAAAAAAAAAHAASGACPHALLDALCDNAAALSRASSLSLSFSDFARFESLTDAELCRDQQQHPFPPHQHPPQQSHQREPPPSYQDAGHGCCKLAAAFDGEADPQRPQQPFPLLRPPTEQLQCGCCRADKGCCSTFSFAVSPRVLSSALDCEAGEQQQRAPLVPIAAVDSNGAAAEPSSGGCVTEAAEPVAESGGGDKPDVSTPGRSTTTTMSTTMTAAGEAGPSLPPSAAAATQEGAVDLAAVDAAVRVLKELRSSLLGSASAPSCWSLGGSSAASAHASAEAEAPGSRQRAPCSSGQRAAAAVASAAAATVAATKGGSGGCGDGCSTVQRPRAVVQPAAAMAPDRAPAAGNVEASLAQAAQALAGLGLLHNAAAAVAADVVVASHGVGTHNASDASAGVEDRAKAQQLQAATCSSKLLLLATASPLAEAAGDDAASDGVPTPEVSPRRGSLRNRTAATLAPSGTAAAAAAGKAAAAAVSAGGSVDLPSAGCRPPGPSFSPVARSLGLLRKIRGEWATVQGQLAAAFDGYAALSRHVGAVAARQRSLQRRCRTVAAAAQQRQRELDQEHVRQRDDVLSRQLAEERAGRAAAEAQLAEERAARAELERQLQLVLRERCCLGVQLGPCPGLEGADGLGQPSLSSASQGSFCGCGPRADGAVRQLAAAEEEEPAEAGCGGKAAALRVELDEMLLCLGQESNKVAVLAAALRAAGCNPDALIAEVEHEYAKMDLA